MSFTRIVLRPIAAGLLIVAAGIYIEVPGPYRALTPAAFGLTKIEPGFYIDVPARAPAVRSLIRKAKSNSAAFFGASDVEPRMVICTRSECAKIFGMKSLGLAVGYHLVMIAPHGVNERTLTHERAHIDLHTLLDVTDFAGSRFPIWFDEGLASHIAGDNRLAQPRNPRDADWILAAQRQAQWKAFREFRSSAQIYGAAARLVAEIEKRHGRHGLKSLVDRVADGADFNAEYAKLASR